MPVPKLTPKQLLTAGATLRRLPKNSPVAREVMAALLEAATPDRHDPNRIEGEHGKNVRETQRLAKSHTSQVLRRAATGLRKLSDAEWAELVAEAEREAARGESD